MLTLRGFIAIPPYASSEFDHGDVHLASGRVFVAHTAAATIEALDGEQDTHLATIPGCPEASGVLCAQEEGLVFAAARGSGTLLVLNALSATVQREIAVGPRPNGLAWDLTRKRLLVADVRENTARLLDPLAAQTVATTELPGRLRWCVYDRRDDRFLVNIREPACVVALTAARASEVARYPISNSGPHGLDIDVVGGQAFVACDGGAVVALDLASGRENARVPIAGSPNAIWYNARAERLYVAIEEPGVVEVIDTRKMTVEQRIATEPGAHTTAFDAQRQRLYVFLPVTCRAAVYEEE
jgi:DNA-binding beta-propeller fold protein YncE